MSGAVGTASRGNPDTWCAPLPTDPLQDTSAQVSHGHVSFGFAIKLCPTSAKQTSGAFFGGIGTNLWAVES